MRLQDVVEELEPALRARLAAIHLERGPDGTWLARLSIALWREGEVATAGPYRIEVERADLPAGVAASGPRREPERPTTMAGDVEPQIQALGATGLLGALRWSRFGPVVGGPLDGRMTYVVTPSRVAWPAQRAQDAGR